MLPDLRPTNSLFSHCRKNLVLLPFVLCTSHFEANQKAIDFVDPGSYVGLLSYLCRTICFIPIAIGSLGTRVALITMITTNINDPKSSIFETIVSPKIATVKKLTEHKSTSDNMRILNIFIAG